MTQKEDTRTEGRKREGRTAAAHPLLSLHCVLRWRYLPFYKSHRSPAMHRRPQALQFPWHYTAAAESIPPPHPRAPHVACESFGSERQVREDNRIRHRYKTNRKEEEDFTERKEGGMDGGRVGGRGRRCRAHRPSRLAPLATRGGDHDTWRGILGRIAFFHRFHATRAVDAAEETRRSLA